MTTLFRQKGGRRSPGSVKNDLVSLRPSHQVVKRDQDVCTKCGACCKALFIFVTPEDLEREPKLEKAVSRLKNKPEHQEILGEYSNRYLLAAGWAIPCPMLDSNNECTIYETRPQNCRDWKPERSKCQAMDARLKQLEQAQK